MIIAFEGIDACGKSTQIEMLKNWWDSNNQSKARIFSYPNYDSLSGRVIKRFLNERPTEDFPLILQSLMTVNRLENQAELSLYEKNGLAILDRYWLSGLVYGHYDGLPQEWLLEIHQTFTQPDLWIVLDVSVEQSFLRRPERDDQYETDKERLESVRDLYLQSSPRGAFILNGTIKPDEIHEIVLRRLALSLLD